MAKVINIQNDLSDSQDLGTCKIESAEFLGFIFSNNKTIVDFIWVFTDDDKNNYLIRSSFLLDKNDTREEKYFDHPLYRSINMNFDYSNRIRRARSIIENFNASNSFYSDFVPVEFVSNCPIIPMIKKDISNSKQYKKIILSLDLYVKLSMIKFSVCSKYLFSPDICSEQFTNFKNYSLHDDCTLSYLGSENGATPFEFTNFFNITYSSSEKLGICKKYINPEVSNLLLSKPYDSDKFCLFYKNNVVVDDSMLIPIYWKDEEGKIILKFIINRYISKDFFLISQEDFLTLIDPKKLMFNINGGNKDESSRSI